MLNNLFIPIAEWLFWFTNGELLLNTIWFLPWVLGWSLILISPIIYVLYFKSNDSIVPTWPGLVFLIGFFPAMLMASGPGIVQMNMVQECRIISAEVTIENVTTTKQIQQCRTKENFYDAEYGPWR